MSKDYLIYNPFSEKYTEPNPVIIGKSGGGRQYSLKEIYEKMRDDGIETYVVFDEKKIKRYEEICDSLRGENVDIFPRSYIEFHDPTKDYVVQRCWKCPNSEVIVYPPGMIDILCRLRQGKRHPMVARIYPNGSLKTTALIHGRSIPETIKILHLLDPNGLGPDDIKPFSEECHQRTIKNVGMEQEARL